VPRYQIAPFGSAAATGQRPHGSYGSRFTSWRYAPIFPVWCMHNSCVCMPALSIFCLVDTPPYIHVCPVISNLSAYYVYVLILTEAADICIFEILLYVFLKSYWISTILLTYIYRSCVLHGCLGISTSLRLALSFEHFSLEFSYTHGLSVPTSHIMSWIVCLELDQMYTKKQSLTGLLAYIYSYFEVLLGELWWFLYIYNI